MRGDKLICHTDNSKLVVVNLLGGPGVGKSHTAHILTTRLASQPGLKVEYVSEYAKEVTYRRDHQQLLEQDHIFAVQNARLRHLVGQVDIAVMDSSLLLGLLYTPTDFPPSFHQFVVDMYNTYDNVNVVLTRNPEIAYREHGRKQSLDESVVIDTQVHQLLDRLNISYHTVQAGFVDTCDHIQQIVANHLQTGVK